MNYEDVHYILLITLSQPTFIPAFKQNIQQNTNMDKNYKLP